MERQMHQGVFCLMCPVVCGLLIRSMVYFNSTEICMLTKEGVAVSLQEDGNSESSIALF